ncbi:MAG TPA: response regulator [Bauldia sp.]|nr:response regulator [Bauldia sp.]
MPKPIEILLVEDNPAEVRLTVEGLKEARIANNLNAVMDGQSAIDYLERRGRHADAVRPDLILLDLNLPGIDGRSVLKHVKESPTLKVIPVVIITSSEAETDIIKSYEAHANCFISKPIDFEGFIRVIRSIEHFWFTVVRLP